MLEWPQHLKLIFSNIQGQLTPQYRVESGSNSNSSKMLVQGRIWLKFKLIQDVMVILVSSKNEEDPIKIEGARVATIQNIDFSNTQGQITPQSKVRSGRNSNSCEILQLFLLPARMKKVH